jgi:protein-tyrosine phosphatase
MPIHIIFVCLGNICRSPSAQGILEKLVHDAGLKNKITVDSCGTAAFNVGKSPDPRAMAACERQGYDISEQIARQITPDDYLKADYVIAMDNINMMSVKAWAPDNYAGELSLFMRYGGATEHAQVPDPYYLDADKFDGTVKVLEKAAKGLLEYVKEKHQL